MGSSRSSLRRVPDGQQLLQETGCEPERSGRLGLVLDGWSLQPSSSVSISGSSSWTKTAEDTSGPRTWRRSCPRIPSETESLELFSSRGGKLWTFPRLSGFWLTSVPRRKTGPETACSRSRPTVGTGNSNVSLGFSFSLKLPGNAVMIEEMSLLSCLPAVRPGPRREDLQNRAAAGAEGDAGAAGDGGAAAEHRGARHPGGRPGPGRRHLLRRVQEVAGESGHRSQDERSLPGVKPL